ncbi:TetR/AcrR family transcriptional regulator [Phenylobacterium sp. LjRoot225]|uniref:TetR/AcrR family transcriptional regulator n=1 Tax=Phenylobacterium sp. LjRoot225 TaxID=3342285 RepID=UPI003ED0828A
MNSTRRFGPENSATRTLLLDATAQLMLDEGYAAVSTRRVAKTVGLTPALVHYYFKTTDDLLVALYRRTTEQNLERLKAALNSPAPLTALWELSADAVRTSLTIEFMALANHRKAIKVEIARYAEFARGMQAQTVAQVLGDDMLARDFPPVGVTVLIAAVARSLVMEENVGIYGGHAEARVIVELLLRRAQPDHAPKLPPAPPS